MLPNNDARVALLQEVAKDFSTNRSFMVIQSKIGSVGFNYELSSVTPIVTRRGKRSLDEDRGPTYHCKWVPPGHVEDVDKEARSSLIHLGHPIPYFGNSSSFLWSNAPEKFYSAYLEGNASNNAWKNAVTASIRTQFLFGDPDQSALYAISISLWTTSPNKDLVTYENKQIRKLHNIFVVRHVLWAIKNELPVSSEILRYLGTGKYYDNDEGASIASLKALWTVWQLYQSLPYATIDLRVATRPLYRAHWIPKKPGKFQHLESFSLTQEQTFSCIALFESGTFDLHPFAMSGVLAISSGNSLYIAGCLLGDPCKTPNSPPIKRVVGNLGRSGMAMLISPKEPRMPRMNHNSWTCINHNSFDGVEQDFFQSTTLHMTFTEWQLPIDVGSRGFRDVEAYYIEAAISVHEKGKWVADVDILNIFQHPLSRIIPECTFLHKYRVSNEELYKIVSIDCWEELLDSPPEVAVVRARGNWQARLAAAALSLQRGHETRIIPEKVCWTCSLSIPKLPKLEAQVDQNHEEDHAQEMAIDSFSEDELEMEYADELQPEVKWFKEMNSSRNRFVNEIEDHDEQLIPEPSKRNVMYIL